jgi:hypothetical protein
MNSNNIGESLLSAITHSDAPDAMGELAELGIDRLLSEGLLQDIPFLGTLFKCIKTGVTIKDWVFVRKVGHFLLALHEINPHEKKAFQEKLNNDPEMAKKVSESLIIILDRLDDLEKPQILAKLFNAHIEEKIDFSTFRRLASAVERAYIDDLKDIIQEKLDAERINVVQEQLLISGLTKIQNIATVSKPSSSNSRPSYRPKPPKPFPQSQSNFEMIGRAHIQSILSELGHLYVKIMKNEL